MTHSFIQTDFADLARQAQFEDVRAALVADTGAMPTLLLGNLVVDASGMPLDAVIVRPHSITVLIFVPEAGHLSIPALSYGAWLLNGKALHGVADFDNPFEQFNQQKAALDGWLRNWLSAEQANLRFITGVVLFGGPLRFGPEVEEQLNSAATANSFQLLADARQMPRRLRQLSTPEIDISEAELNQLLRELTTEADCASEAAASEIEAGSVPDVADEKPRSVNWSETPAEQLPEDEATPAAGTNNFLSQKARQLWGWLGAADIPDDDPSYGYDPGAAAARGEEKARLEELRQQMQTELSAQLNAMQAREAERERSIAQLRTELAQAPAVAPEAATLQARLAAENQEKAALEAAILASQQEAAARNQALDAKIEQLTRLIGQLSARPPEQPAPRPATPAAPPAAGPTLTEPTSDEPTIAAPVAAKAASLEDRPAAVPSSQPVDFPAAAGTPVQPAPRPEAVSAPKPAFAAEPKPEEARPLRPLASDLGQQAIALWHKAAARPEFGQLRNWVRGQPRRKVLIAAGLVLLVLVGWGLSQLGSQPLTPLKQDGHWGYAKANGEVVIPARYDVAEPFQDGRAVVAQAGAYGIVDEEGQPVVAPDYDALNPYSDGYARARVGEAYTFLDEQGQEFGTYYFNALDFAEGYAAVLDHRGWYYISGPEEPVTPPLVFREAYSFHDGLARVRLPDGYTYITKKFLADSSGGTKPFGRYELAEDFADGRARVSQGGRRFFIDHDGEEVK